ncbi:MAG TPA: MFS transporter, partial [Rhizomicrobium sp.]
MAVAAESVSRPSAGIGGGVVPLLALAIFINYVDRGNLATAAPLMKDELHLTGSQIGLLFSAFYWTYIPSQILAGWLAERINAYRTLALGLFFWSLATAATGLASSFALLIALRLILGVGESAAFPCSSKLLARHLPSNRLGTAIGAIATGLALGPALGT